MKYTLIYNMKKWNYSLPLRSKWAVIYVDGLYLPRTHALSYRFYAWLLRGRARERKTENSTGSAWQNLHSKWRLGDALHVYIKNLAKIWFCHSQNLNCQSTMFSNWENYCVQKMITWKKVFPKRMASITIFAQNTMAHYKTDRDDALRIFRNLPENET